MAELNIPVTLVDPATWPEAHGKDIRLIDVPDPAQKFALLRCFDLKGLARQRLVLKSAVRRRPVAPAPDTLDHPPLRWGALVTLKNGQTVICTHPDIEPDGNWRGIPLGYRSFHAIHYSEIADIQHVHDIIPEAA